MNLVNSMIVGNVIMIAFNMIAMACRLRCPPISVYVATWLSVIAGIYYATNGS